MNQVTIRVPATTANLGPGFDAFGCALSLYTDVTFEETDSGLEITGCDEAFTGPDNLAYTSYCAVLASLSEEVRGVKIHINAQIPLCRGLGGSAGRLVAVNVATTLARSVLPALVSRADAIYKISHGAMVLKALELGDEKLLRNAMQDKLHQNYRKKLIPDYEKIEALVRTTGAAFCLSGAGPTLLVMTRNPALSGILTEKLPKITEHNWEILPLHVEFQGAKAL